MKDNVISEGCGCGLSYLPFPRESKCCSSYQQEWKQAWQTPHRRTLKPEGKTIALTSLTSVCSPAEWTCQIKILSCPY